MPDKSSIKVTIFILCSGLHTKFSDTILLPLNKSSAAARAPGV